jgi:transcriptional regulator with XRE-family HTH domain
MLGRPHREDNEHHFDAMLLVGKVKWLRQELGFTQETLAQAAGVSVYTVSKLEQGGRVDLSVFTVDALARALNTTVDDLLHGSRNSQTLSEAQPDGRGNFVRPKQARTVSHGRSQTKNDLPIPTPAPPTEARRQRGQKRPED